MVYIQHSQGFIRNDIINEAIAHNLRKSRARGD